jgi:hypothetical protein
MSVTYDLARRLNARAREVLRHHGISGPEARQIVHELRTNGHDFCTICHYKVKRRTGDPLPLDTEANLADLEDIIRLPQRDGDAGDLEIRRTHAYQVLWAFYHAENGLTDHELQAYTGIFLDSAKGMRANLMKHGWIRASGAKRPSWNDRPMEVWYLGRTARRTMQEHVPRRRLVRVGGRNARR